MTAPIKRIKVCLNGRRQAQEHPAVPVTPTELAVAARDAVAAGAEAVHLHARGADGAESVLAGDVGAAVAAVRVACPGVPVGVSTGLWITGDPVARRGAVARWADLPPNARPDFASVNIGEPGPEDLAGLLAAAGIAAEAGVWSVADVTALATGAASVRWLRIMVELSGVSAEDAVPAADAILDHLRERGHQAPLLLHGADESAWPLVAHAGRLGLATRIGLEDVTTGPEGQPVSGNAELITLALDRWTAAGNAAG
jgi:uncharacterized protein (DUF849 family)